MPDTIEVDLTAALSARKNVVDRRTHRARSPVYEVAVSPGTFAALVAAYDGFVRDGFGPTESGAASAATGARGDSKPAAHLSDSSLSPLSSDEGFSDGLPCDGLALSSRRNTSSNGTDSSSCSDRSGLGLSGMNRFPLKEGPLTEIVVTRAMIEAGISELYEHSFADKWEDVLEEVFRAMAYASFDASDTSDST